MIDRVGAPLANMRTLLIGSALPALLSAIPAQDERAPFEAATFAFPASTSIVSVADLDGDGDQDAIGWYWIDTAFSSLRLSTFTNDGTGRFSPRTTETVSNNSGLAMTWDVQVGRLDAIAGNDFVAAFGVTVLPSVAPRWTEPAAVMQLTVADFDGDSFDDVAVLLRPVFPALDQELRLYRNAGNAFTLVGSLLTRGIEMRVAELDGDGRPDLVLRDGANVRLLLVAGGGSSITQADALPYALHPSEVPMLVVGDIDGDRDDDIVVFVDFVQGINGRAEYLVWRRTGAAAFAAEPRVAGGPATGLADIDGDGDLDGTCCGGGGPTPVYAVNASTIHLAKNDGSGRFAKAWTIPNRGGLRFAGAVDVDGDGDRDLVAGRTIFFNQSGFRIDPQPDAGVRTAALQTADLDGDGDPDLHTAPSQRLDNDGMGGFTTLSVPFPPPPIGGWGIGSYAGDFDGDGDIDHIVRHTNGSTFYGMRLLRNNGGGGYTDGGYAAAAGVSFDGATSGFDILQYELVSDVDRDGDADLILSGRTWLNDGTGFFPRAQFHLMGVPKALADLDQDGHLDVVTGGRVGFGSSDGRFDPIGPYLRVNHPDASVAVGDLDGDGWLDIAYVETTAVPGVLHVVWNYGNRAFADQPLPIPVPMTTSSSDVGYAFLLDLDGDGRTDLCAGPTIWSHGNAALVLYGDGSRTPSRWTAQVLDPRLVADVDGDGDADVLGADLARGARLVLPRDGLRRQFGTATVGLGQMRPVLGASGPFRAGSTIALHLRGAMGGTLAVFVLGLQESNVADWPLPGLNGYALPVAAWFAVSLGGEPGIAGAGHLSIPVAVPAGLSGLVLCHQAFFVDPTAPSGVTQSNGLELRYR
jgi:hypothetical protein